MLMANKAGQIVQLSEGYVMAVNHNLDNRNLSFKIQSLTFILLQWVPRKYQFF